MINSIISKAITPRTLDNCGLEVDVWSPSMTSKPTEKLFAVCMAELTSIPFVFQAKNPQIRPETSISMNPALLYPWTIANIMA